MKPWKMPCWGNVFLLEKGHICYGGKCRELVTRETWMGNSGGDRERKLKGVTLCRWCRRSHSRSRSDSHNGSRSGSHSDHRCRWWR